MRISSVLKDVVGFGWPMLLIAALTATSALASERAIEIHFQKSISVNGSRVVLGDVATIYAKNLKHFEKVSSLVIGEIPEEQKQLSVPMEYVRMRVFEALANEKITVKISAPELIVFNRMKIETGVERLAQMIRDLAGEQKKIPVGVEASPEVSTSADLQSLDLNKYRIESAADRDEWRGHMVFRLVPKEGAASAIWVNARIRWYMQAWVAKNSIAYFKDISADQFEMGKVEVTQMRELPIVASNKEELDRLVRETRAKRSFRPSTPLMASMLDRKPDIKSGQKLKVVFVAEGGLRVATDGVIMADGIVGEAVKARLKTSKKVVAGRLTSPDSLEVSL